MGSTEYYSANTDDPEAATRKDDPSIQSSADNKEEQVKDVEYAMHMIGSSISSAIEGVQEKSRSKVYQVQETVTSTTVETAKIIGL